MCESVCESVCGSVCACVCDLERLPLVAPSANHEPTRARRVFALVHVCARRACVKRCRARCVGSLVENRVFQLEVRGRHAVRPHISLCACELCVCACVCVRARVCVSVCVSERECVSEWMRGGKASHLYQNVCLRSQNRPHISVCVCVCMCLCVCV